MSPLPHLDAVSALLSNLLGDAVRVAACPALPTPNVRAVATFAAQPGGLTYAIAADTAFVASSGAALALLPAAVAAEAIASDSPPVALVDNAREILRTAAALFEEIDGDALHVQVAAIFVAPPVPPTLAALITRPAARLDLEVVVPGYPEGKLALLSITRR